MSTAPRSLPQNVDAEQAVLGGLMLRPASLAEISDWIATDDFYRRDHQLIYRAILELAEKEKPFDAVTLGDWFESMAMSEQVGGGTYLIELASTTPSAANIKAYAEIVLDRAKWRRLIDIGIDLANIAQQPGARDVAEVTQEHQSRLSMLASDPHVGLEPAKASLKLFYDDLLARHEAQSIPGLPLPWSELNALTHGLQDGEVIVVAARSNMGKSAVGFRLRRVECASGKQDPALQSRNDEGPGRASGCRSPR